MITVLRPYLRSFITTWALSLSFPPYSFRADAARVTPAPSEHGAAYGHHS
jgi:hypothetical protein